MDSFISKISNRKFPVSEKISGNSIRENIFRLIQKDHEDFTRSDSLALSELNRYRQLYISNYLNSEVGELSYLENNVLKTIQNKESLSLKIDTQEEHQKISAGEKLADKVASFGGSWRFIMIFAAFIIIWMLLNTLIISKTTFDPYPFILLNLILSCLAAIQAPIIMMSQNRQEGKDRERSKNDYMINLKSELEIRMLHEKVDHLIIHQQQELLNIQQIQIDMLEDILKKFH